MEVTRIHDGLWRWSVTRAGMELASTYLEHGDVMLLVDPVLPAAGDDLARFERAITRDRERLGGPAWVLVTREAEPRDADAAAALAGARRWAPDQPPPPGIAVLATGRDGEVAFWSAAHAALMPGTAIGCDEGRPVAARGVDAELLVGCAATVVIPAAGPMWSRP